MYRIKRQIICRNKISAEAGIHNYYPHLLRSYSSLILNSEIATPYQTFLNLMNFIAKKKNTSEKRKRMRMLRETDFKS